MSYLYHYQSFSRPKDAVFQGIHLQTLSDWFDEQYRNGLSRGYGSHALKTSILSKRKLKDQPYHIFHARNFRDASILWRPSHFISPSDQQDPKRWSTNGDMVLMEPEEKTLLHSRMSFYHYLFSIIRDKISKRKWGCIVLLCERSSTNAMLNISSSIEKRKQNLYSSLEYTSP